MKLYDGNVQITPALVDTAVGDIVVFDTNSIGVAQTAGLTGENISVDTTGVFEVDATDAEAFVAGEIAKFDVSTKKCLILGAVTAGKIWLGKGAGEVSTIQVKIG